MTIFEPVTATAHVSPAATVAHVGVLESVTPDGSGSVTWADPAAVPTFFTTTAYASVPPGITDFPLPGVSDFVTVNFGVLGGVGGGPTGFVTVEEQKGDVHGPVVIVAVLTTVAVSVDFTVAS
jgi:hypothetical protein